MQHLQRTVVQVLRRTALANATRCLPQAAARSLQSTTHTNTPEFGRGQTTEGKINEEVKNVTSGYGWNDGSSNDAVEPDPSMYEQAWAQRKSSSDSDSLGRLQQERLQEEEAGSSSQMKSSGQSSSNKMSSSERDRKRGDLDDQSGVVSDRREEKPSIHRQRGLKNEMTSDSWMLKSGEATVGEELNGAQPIGVRKGRGKTKKRGSSVHGPLAEDRVAGPPSREFSSASGGRAMERAQERPTRTPGMRKQESFMEQGSNFAEMSDADSSSNSSSWQQAQQRSMSAIEDRPMMQPESEPRGKQRKLKSSFKSSSNLKATSLSSSPDMRSPNMAEGWRKFHFSVLRAVYSNPNKPNQEDQIRKDINSHEKGRVDVQKEASIKSARTRDGSQASGNIVASPEREGVFDKPAGAAGVASHDEELDDRSAARFKGQNGLKLRKSDLGQPAFELPREDWHTDVQDKCATQDLTHENRKGEKRNPNV